jgi:hypothetical protein
MRVVEVIVVLSSSRSRCRRGQRCGVEEVNDAPLEIGRVLRQVGLTLLTIPATGAADQDPSHGNRDPLCAW